MGGGFVCMQHNYCSAFIVTELLCILYMNDILAFTTTPTCQHRQQIIICLIKLNTLQRLIIRKNNGFESLCLVSMIRSLCSGVFNILNFT